MLRPTRQRGFTLIEVMVTVFIVAIGLLGAAALQAISKKAAVDAMQRTTASVLAQDMLERIRSNSQQAAMYASSTGSGGLTGPPGGAVDCGATAAQCSPTDLVAYDLSRWLDGLNGAAEVISTNGSTSTSGGLRSPTGCIRYNGTVVEVVIAWRGLTAITQGDNSSSLTTAEDPTNDGCGLGQPDYQVAGGSGGVSYRRVLRLQAHV